MNQVQNAVVIRSAANYLAELAIRREIPGGRLADLAWHSNVLGMAMRAAHAPEPVSGVSVWGHRREFAKAVLTDAGWTEAAITEADTMTHAGIVAFRRTVQAVKEYNRMVVAAFDMDCEQCVAVGVTCSECIDDAMNEAASIREGDQS